MIKKLLIVGFAACATLAALATGTVQAQELKIGVVNSERILRDSTPARASMQKIEAEFAKRQKDMEDMGARFKAAADKFEKDGPIMTEADRGRRQRELADNDREFQRKQRELREDFNQRRNEEVQGLLDRANRVIRQIAEQEKYDVILQEAVYFSPRVDITEKVLRTLNSTTAGAAAPAPTK